MVDTEGAFNLSQPTTARLDILPIGVSSRKKKSTQPTCKPSKIVHVHIHIDVEVPNSFWKNSMRTGPEAVGILIRLQHILLLRTT